MKVAVTYDNGTVFGHFGHTEQFKIYEVEGAEIVSSEVVDTNGSGHGALSAFLAERGVEVLICGGIGMGARIALDDAGIELLPGVSGDADAAVAAYARGELNFNPDATCSHHHGEGHTCGGHDHDHDHHHCGGHCGHDHHGCGGNH